MKKSVALFFLLVFSISLPGFSIEVHFCEGEITDVALLGHAACQCENKHDIAFHVDSHESACQKHCHDTVDKNHKEVSAIQKECCKTEKLTLTSSKLKAHSSHKTAQVVLIATAILNPYVITELFSQREVTAIPYLPPSFKRDLNILNSVFII